MRRKSERTASKKSKTSPEKKEKPEKVKRPKTRRTKGSTSSDNESAEESTQVQPVAPETVAENNPPQTPQTSNKEDSPEETNEQVWQVKTTEGGDVGEIQKLKICLTRPPSTPERVDRSPRSKRKHSRSASGEPSEERKKTKHRSKRSAADSKEGSDRNPDSQGDEPENETDQEKKLSDVSQTPQKQEATSDNTPMSTTSDDKTSEETKDNDNENKNTANEESSNQDKQSDESKSETQDKPSDADTTVASPKSDTEDRHSSLAEKEDSPRQGSVSGDKSEILEIHADESKLETSEVGTNDSQESPKPSNEKNGNELEKSEVSIITGDKVENIHLEDVNSTEDKQVTTNKQNVVESSKTPDKEIVSPDEAKKEPTAPNEPKNIETEQPKSESVAVNHEGIVHNGQTATHSNRKRRWGSRPSRITTQKSITISTDVLKDIIPDVKPVEFDEVIEEKKHSRRVEVTEKLERPVLPKIVIDNTESVEINKKDNDERDKENVKIRETNMSSNRKISIVKDSDSIIARPPSPPRHKQSNVLYITNLVRPFTLPQLKNLLQRTGRIVDNGFWIDRIKSKCFVQYETEDQAVETRHALHGVTWPVSNPKTLHVDFSTQEDFNKAKANEETDNAQASTIPGTVEDWLREQDIKRERGELEKPWEKKMTMREWDVGKNEKIKEKEKPSRDDRFQDKRRHRTPERSPEPAKKFKKKEEEAPAKLLDDLFRKTKATPCIYWLPLSAETIAIKEEQRRQHMAEHERRLQELRRTHRRH